MAPPSPTGSNASSSGSGNDSLWHAVDNDCINHNNPARWAATDRYTLSHSHPAAQRANAKILQDTLTASRDAGLPDISLSAAQGKFLALHCRATGVTHALEVGTLGGYSAIWLASENPQLHITTVEYSARHVAVAQQNVERAGLTDRIEIIHGAGLDILPRLRDEVVGAAAAATATATATAQQQQQQNKRPRFGFVFIDADKNNNWAYFKLAMQMVKPNSVICVDNVVKLGRFGVPSADHQTHPVVVGSREVVEKAGQEPGVDSVVLQMVGEKEYDGWLWAVVDTSSSASSTSAPQ